MERSEALELVLDFDDVADEGAEEDDEEAVESREEPADDRGDCNDETTDEADDEGSDDDDTLLTMGADDDAVDVAAAEDEPIEVFPLIITVVPPFFLEDELLIALETEEATQAGKFTNSHPPSQPFSSHTGVVQ